MLSIERHARMRQVELARSIAGRRKIYLDACFWITVRDAALGARTDPPSRKLLHYLRRGVAQGELICPISATMFLELMKQPYRQDRRIGSARLIDELSLGVSLIPGQTMVGTEVASFLMGARGYVEVYPMQELVWTKAAYVLGDTHPTLPGLTAEEELRVQIAFFDHLWSYSLSEMVDVIGGSARMPHAFGELCRHINDQNNLFKDELRSFEQTYDTELRGAIEIAGEIAADVIHDIAQKEARQKLTPTPEGRAEQIKMCRNLIYHAFRKSETCSALRSIHIAAMIHAAMRWNKDQKFTPNDIYDVDHATAALGYCDAFFTDGPLHHLLASPKLRLSEINGCRVFSGIEAAAQYLKAV